MKKIIFSTLLAASMSVEAVCNNATVKGVYDVKVTNADGSTVIGGISFNGLSNIEFPLDFKNWGNWSMTIFPNGIRSTGSGYYTFGTDCKLSAFGAYDYNNKSYQAQLSTNKMTIVSGHATYGTGKFNAATMTLKSR